MVVLDVVNDGVQLLLSLNLAVSHGQLGVDELVGHLDLEGARAARLRAQGGASVGSCGRAVRACATNRLRALDLELALKLVLEHALQSGEVSGVSSPASVRHVDLQRH